MVVLGKWGVLGMGLFLRKPYGKETITRLGAGPPIRTVPAQGFPPLKEALGGAEAFLQFVWEHCWPPSTGSEGKAHSSLHTSFWWGEHRGQMNLDLPQLGDM